MTYPNSITDDEYRRKILLAGDLAFKRAMLAARRKGGTERITIGVVKDNSPIAPSRIGRGLVRLGCGSPSAECVDN